MPAQTSVEAVANVDSMLVQKAMGALLKHHEKSTENSNQLLGSDLTIQVQIGLDKVPQRPSPKPLRIEIPHPLYKKDDGEVPEVCLIVKEESKPWCQEMISKFPDQMGCVKKVLGLQSLRKKYARYEHRRELVSKYDIFMGDDRILPMLAKCLGKNFFETKKQPIPVRLTRKESLPFTILNGIDSTYMFMSSGTCLTIRAGSTGMPMSDLIDNVNSIVKNAVEKVPRKWANVRSISVKTTDSMSLPVYNKTPEELVALQEMAGITSEKQAQKVKQEAEEAAAKEKEAQEAATKKRKQQMAKSPLVRALKKQKSDEKETTSEKEPKSTKKKKEKKSSSSETPKVTQKAAKTETEPVKEKMPKSESKKAKKVKKEEPAKEPAEAKAFMKSKKFSGAKNGYVFRNGDKGVGYYIDVKPVPDKAAMAALARMAQSPARGRRKSAGGSAKAEDNLSNGIISE
eukprot:CAMPEP_0195281950 /NCGR_PEP_ID=MMETSP0707-20130614/1046_1 /TAXON_ID=33640 /ORGANISM="Asterionellopsis glacialis, Strain CCMP134" /LENGTH=456 /DNA_ID=CAMNT_0040340889 /DNA_START=81 /DNA_END=1449 /DNA_ORIENTATION=+